MATPPDDQEHPVFTSITVGGSNDGSPPGNFPKNLPKILLADYCLVCNGIPMQINPRSKTREILSFLMRSPDKRLSVNELTSKLCSLPPPPKTSYRNFEAACHKTVKLVSRSRALLTKKLSQGENHGIQWLLYDHRSKGWKLYNLSQEYFSSNPTSDIETNS